TTTFQQSTQWRTPLFRTTSANEQILALETHRRLRADLSRRCCVRVFRRDPRAPGLFRAHGGAGFHGATHEGTYASRTEPHARPNAENFTHDRSRRFSTEDGTRAND